MEIDIATGISRKSKAWKNKKISWDNLVQRLRKSRITEETFKEYQNAAKEDQLEIKDVGGYVGGYLRSGKRSPLNVMHRQLLTLDIDKGYDDFWDTFQMLYGNAAVIHSTHSHHPDNPRYRLIIPLSREAAPDEYSAVARRIAGTLGIDTFDNTTFELNRLMFWPSSPKDIEYYFEYQEGPPIDVDETLATYIDWRDSSLWPISSQRIELIKTTASKQEDPLAKKGLIGAFCRTHSIQDAIEVYLGDEYDPCADGRYTYRKGTAASGLVVYEDKFAFSHHGTDPAGGKLCNAFDLVRAHKFSHLDNGTQDKSLKAMNDLVLADEAVKQLMAKENLAQAKYDFASGAETEGEDSEEGEEEVVAESTTPTEDDLLWMNDLVQNYRGEYVSSAPNINCIFANDKRLKKKICRNDFDGKLYIFPGIPWRKIKRPEPIRNIDFSGVRNYIESVYGISSQLKIDDALALEAERNHFHPVKDYLSSMQWDGKHRIDNLLIDYFGADDNIYSREAIRKPLVAAVARIFRPGTKFDMMLTLVGEEGTYKSTFIDKLAVNWFSDTFLTVQGKEALEQIQGVWIMEMAELSALRKAEVESIKHFITKREDTFRPAYGRTIETFKRQTIFIGTTNNTHFLTDTAGKNRRFLPIDAVSHRVTKSINEDLDSEISQIWAEAVHLYKSGETLYLSEEADKIAAGVRAEHHETDERTGVIEEYLEKLLPKEWEETGMFDRRTFVRDPLAPDGKIHREVVCIAEIWCECLEQKREEMNRYKTRDINNIMKSLPEWEAVNSTKNFPIYGKQKYYKRKTDRGSPG